MLWLYRRKSGRFFCWTLWEVFSEVLPFEQVWRNLLERSRESSACVWGGLIMSSVCLKRPGTDVDSFLVMEEQKSVTNFSEIVAIPADNMVSSSLPVVIRDSCPCLSWITWPGCVMILTAGCMVCVRGLSVWVLNLVWLSESWDTILDGP